MYYVVPYFGRAALGFLYPNVPAPVGVVSGQARFIPPGSTRSSEGAKHAMTGGGCELYHNLKEAASTPIFKTALSFLKVPCHI